MKHAALFVCLFLAAAIGVGAAIAAGTWWVFGLPVFVVLVLVLRAIPTSMCVVLPLATILTVPAESPTAWNGLGQGFFVLGMSIALVASSVARPRRPALRRADADFFVFVAYLILTALLNLSSGELRPILYWIAAVGVVTWLRSLPLSEGAIAEQLTSGMIIAGSLSSAIAVLASVTSFPVGDFIPGYDTAYGQMPGDSLVRAVGLSGHPLRLGTLAMVAVILSAVRATRSDRPAASRYRAFAVALLNLLALTLSGARGSWLGLLVAGGVMFIWSKRESTIFRFRLAIGIGMAAVVLWLSGLSTYIWERSWGSASAPASIEQRRQAAAGVAEVWDKLPALGLGRGGSLEVALRAGLRIPNIENEYLITLVASGLLGLAILVWCIARRVILVARAQPGPDQRAALAAIVAVAVNIGTYNMFDWPAGPPLFAAVLLLCTGTAPPKQAMVVDEPVADGLRRAH